MTNSSSSNSAIVLGTGVNGIAVIRSLGRMGVRCGALFAPTRVDFARYSRYLRASHVVGAEADDTALIDALRALSNRLRGSSAVLIPTTDRYSQFLSRTHTALADEFLVCNPDPSICSIFLDKWKTAEICLDQGMPIPFTACPRTGDELDNLANEVVFPVIVKPRLTFGTRFPGKNAVCHSKRELISLLGNHALLGECVVQQIIPSGDGDILVVASYSGSRGAVEAIYSGRKIRQYLPDYGATCFGISEPNAQLEQQTRGFLDGIRYKGFAALEFARSRDDGQLYFIELNTRTYYHNQLFADAGVDLTRAAYLSITGRPPQAGGKRTKQREGLIWLDFRSDYQSMRIKRRNGVLTTWSWLRSIVNARSFAWWNWHDPVPFLRACAFRLNELAQNLARRVRRLFTPTPA